ncbi:unnamed protein product [Schistosoma margrebowiei]|uniref:Uncharacterized protein n=1 Tax=Schistosoma margrebowiei TaxID=48269 RepID=A0A183MUJ6_9TREM|nr:unnamed protein product [Schistosoma margrebowiei]
MERPNNVGDQEDKSNSNGNEEIQLGKTHWTQAGQQRLNTGEMLLYSGHEKDNAPHTQGVALMLSKVARHALV